MSILTHFIMWVFGFGTGAILTWGWLIGRLYRIEMMLSDEGRERQANGVNRAIQILRHRA